MSAAKSTQLHITEDGGIGAGPLTWDGEPMFSPETVAETPRVQLFETAAFLQLRGQMALDTDEGKR